MKESDLAKIIVEWLKANQWEVYKEVAIGTTNQRADIVAVQGCLTWIIETKTSLSLALIAQAFRRLQLSHYVSIAVPYVRRNDTELLFIKNLLKDYGIGLLQVERFRNNYIMQTVHPKLNRRRGIIKKYLNEKQKTYAEAGNYENKYWTPFQQTVLNIKKYLARNPGCTWKELIENVDHHYNSNSTARSCIYRWINEGVIKGIKIEKYGTNTLLFLEEIKHEKHSP